MRHQHGDDNYERKKERLRQLWKECYLKVFPEKNIFMKGSTTLLTMDDLKKMHSSLGLFDEYGLAESYPLPTCLIRYSYMRPSPKGRCIRIQQCLIWIPRSKMSGISTEDLSENEISCVVGKMKESLKTFDYESYEKAVGVYRGICYLRKVREGKKMRASKNPGGKTPRIEFLTQDISNWTGHLIWAFGQTML